jgi:hypothetical protein
MFYPFWDKDILYEVSRTPGNSSGCSESIFAFKNVYRESVTHVGQEIVIKKNTGKSE